MKKIVKGFVCLLSLLAAGVAGATDFYWNPSKSSGNWTDAANWFTDAALTQPATAYPKTTSDFVRFNDGTEATITLGEKLTVHTLDLSKANLALTFVGGAGGTNNLLTVSNTFSPGGNNLKLTFDNAALYRNSAADGRRRIRHRRELGDYARRLEADGQGILLFRHRQQRRRPCHSQRCESRSLQPFQLFPR